MAGMTDGFTVTVFSPQLTQPFNQNMAIYFTNPSASASCRGQFGVGHIGWNARGPVTVNGTIGFYANVSQQSLTDALVWAANITKPGCNIVLSDLVVQAFVFSISSSPYTPVTRLDALAIGLGQGNFPR